MNLGMLKLLGEPIAANSAAIKETRNPASRTGHGAGIVDCGGLVEDCHNCHFPRSVMLPSTNRVPEAYT